MSEASFCSRLLYSDVPYALKLAALSSRSEGSRASLLVIDLAWLATRMPHKFYDLDHPSRCRSQWLDRIQEYGTKWNSLVAKLCETCDPALGASLSSSDHAASHHDADMSSTHICSDCDASVDTVAELCTHRFIDVTAIVIPPDILLNQTTHAQCAIASFISAS